MLNNIKRLARIIGRRRRSVSPFGLWLIALCLLTAGFYAYQQNSALAIHQIAQLPNPTAGGADAAVERTREIIPLLRSVGWDSLKIKASTLQLPDRGLAEDEAYRRPNQPSYLFPNGSGKFMDGDPVYEKVACVSEIYVKANPTYYADDKARFTPGGFYIVGWKDGTVTKVAVRDVRYNPGIKEKSVMTFPGMPNYDPKGYRLSTVEFADGIKNSDDAKRMRDYIAATVSPCAGCKD